VSTIGNCDCGDHQLINSERFCSKHHGSSQLPHIDRFEPEVRESLFIFSEFLFSKLNDENFEEIFSILTRLVSIGDGTRRCIILGIGKFIDHYISNFFQNPFELNSRMISFFGQLINDSSFLMIWSQSIFRYSLYILKYLCDNYLSTISHQQANLFSSFLFHAFSHSSFEEGVRHKIDFSHLF
jgi:hypothetical protein